MDLLHLTLRQLQIFSAVARTGSTTAASEQVALSQSAVSTAIKELERLLDVPLFDRAGKRLLLNERGRALLPHALALLDGAAAIERLARNDGGEHLRIGASTTLGNYVLPSLLSRYLVADAAPGGGGHAAWQSHIVIGNTAQVCARVAAFELDIGLIEGPCHDNALAATPWLQDEMVVVARAEPPGTRTLALSRAALRERIWLLRESGSGTRETTDQLLLPYLGGYRRSMEMASSEAIQRAVAEGLGVACLSHWAVADLLAQGRLAAVRPTQPDGPPLVRQCYWVTHRDKRSTPALTRFVNMLRHMALESPAAGP